MSEYSKLRAILCFRSFNLEKLLSAEATVTGTVNSMRRATLRLGYISLHIQEAFLINVTQHAERRGGIPIHDLIIIKFTLLSFLRYSCRPEGPATTTLSSAAADETSSGSPSPTPSSPLTEGSLRLGPAAHTTAAAAAVIPAAVAAPVK